MKQLDILRKQIDKIDKKLIVLLAQRAAVSKKIGDSKKKHNKPVLDAKRWKTVLQTRIQQAEIHDLPANFIKKIFTLIHTYSKDIQKNSIKTIAYLGPKNSYSYLAAKQVFPHYAYKPCKTFFEIHAYVLSKKQSVGILPVENSIAGFIHENENILLSENISVIAETYLKIRLNLIGLQHADLSHITTVYSHPKALLQCSKFIQKHKLKTVEASSTSQARVIVEEKHSLQFACIGSNHLANNLELKLIEEDIGNEKNNITRFAFITKE